MVESEVAVIHHAIVTELNGLESDARHQGPYFLAGYGWLVDGDGDVGLGDEGSDAPVPGVEGEPFETIGGFREDGGMKEHPVEIVAQRAPEDTTVEALVPAGGSFLELDLMFRSADFSLFGPTGEESVFGVERPFGVNLGTERLASGLIHHAQAAELGDRLRELWDLR